MKPQKESDIQKVILQWLTLQPNTFAFRVQSTGVPIGVTGKFRKNHNKGIADIQIVKNGKSGAFEVKSEKGRIEPHQREWLEKFAKAGGAAFVVRSLEDAIESYNEI